MHGELLMKVDVGGSGQVPMIEVAASTVMVHEVEPHVADHKVGVASVNPRGEFVDTDEGHVETVVASLGG